MSEFIRFQDVSLHFRTYRNPSPSLKESFIAAFTKQKHVTQKDEFFALKDINLQINSGERIGLIGLNGAGKSTLLKVVAGIYPPTTGIVQISGQVTPMIELGTGLDMDLSGRENIYINGSLLGYSKAEMKTKEQDVIDFSELSEFIDMPLKYYSSGMLSRLIFSVGTMVDPEILIIDEIFSAGDARFVEKATNRMEELLDKSRIVLFVSHSLGLVERICNRAIVLDHGRIVNDGAPKKMVEYYLNNIVSN
jgi:ABC-type polysaccharide/polyol phosphate transport system ATPase subunit